MKKTYQLSHPKIKVARLIEAAKHDVKKYIKRERRKDLPKGADYWGFDCKYGVDQASAQEIHVGEINKYIDEAESQALPSFYLEMLVKPVTSAPQTQL
jgi:hypothetical protein|tara:strand:+ start:580 stop:873 length:294 start_codon:yes stop_codon:yes gene_type:complete